MHRSTRTVATLVLTAATVLGLTAGPAAAQFRRLDDVQVAATADQAPAGDSVLGMDGQLRSRQIVGPPARDAAEIVIAPGDDVAAVLNAHPAGTAFRIAAGVHHAARLPVQDGDVLTGDRGAILDGAQQLAAGDFRSAGRTWVTSRDETPFTADGTPTGPLHGETVEGRERDAANHDVWVDGVRAQHVASRAAVAGPLDFHLDYAAGELVIGADPARHTVELTTAVTALDGRADDVTVQHLTVRRYASPAQHGAIHVEGAGWTLRHLEVVDNHGGGVKLDDGSALTDSLIARNGQIGVTSWDGEDILVARNELTENLALGYRWEWEGGATKFKHTTDAVITENWVHANNGPGIWFDVNNTDATIERNVVEDNLWAGVFYEISYGARIADNTVRNNAEGAWGDLGSGIWISNSSDVEITGNVLHGNRIEVLATHSDRGEGIAGTWATTGLDVHHNTIEVSGSPVGLRVENGDTHLLTAAGNRFEANTYHLAGQQNFFWGSEMSAADWQALGFDATGTFTSDLLATVLPLDFTSSFYGS